jgi:hypothetical protein
MLNHAKTKSSSEHILHRNASEKLKRSKKTSIFAQAFVYTYILSYKKDFVNGIHRNIQSNNSYFFMIAAHDLNAKKGLFSS